MKLAHKLLAMASIAMAAALPAASHAIEPIVVLNEHFNDISTLNDWALDNKSIPPGQSWSQGNAGVFPAPSGPASSYIAANFLSAQNGMGSIDNWLITPVVTLIGPSELSFFTRSASASGFGDTLEVRFSPGSGTDTGSFNTVLGVLGGISAYPTVWQQVISSLDHEGQGRFAFRYAGDASAANYIGIDAVVVTTVPEPGTYLMLLVGLGSLALLRRRQLTMNKPGRFSTC
ncbi:choice-of-anchor J family PEP-CTERM protein [Massilia scottii]|uniref:choice-of-anchor J family PEP-CTERM protein n=1 Tax=Massilia scottii TaxID=3057166 RepID=UPI00279652C7|nr:choice-of-anchor J domain-containing protein [Massilia sp. CCM 9029]MDQ1830428.1 choice-of-anchor J domain-containing protein [Massilia sp. CCM 9029]